MGRKDMKKSEFEAVKSDLNNAIFEEWYFKKCEKERERNQKMKDEDEQKKQEIIEKGKSPGKVIDKEEVERKRKDWLALKKKDLSKKKEAEEKERKKRRRKKDCRRH